MYDHKGSSVPKDRRTSADVAWQFVKELKESPSHTTYAYLRLKFKPSPTTMHLAIKWLKKQGFIIENGGMVALSTKGYEFYEKRKQLLDN